MKILRNLFIVALLGTALALTSCSKDERTVGGALIGAGAGAAIGSAVGNTEGAVIGGIGGAVVGGAIGRSTAKD